MEKNAQGRQPAVAEAPEDALPGIFKDNRLEDQQDYLANWLTAAPASMRTLRSCELDGDKRFDAVLSALHAAVDPNVIPLKKFRK